MSGCECEEWCVFSERFFFCVCVLRALFHFSFTSLRDLQGGWTLLGVLDSSRSGGLSSSGGELEQSPYSEGLYRREGSESVLEECESIEDE